MAAFLPISGRPVLRSRTLAVAGALLLLSLAVQAVRPAESRAGTTFSFGVVGDIGANTNTGAVLNAIASSGTQAFFAMGDLSYSQVPSESAWCDYVTSRVGASFPYELVAGNHEDDGPDGLISNFASCLPDKLGGLQGDYPRQYYIDYPAASPLVRFIMISPKLIFPPSTTAWSYALGTARYNWTASAIDSARAAGIPWVVVGMHMYCLSLVNFPCASGQDIMNLMFAKKVDVYLQAHDHGYARTKQLALNPSCPAMPTTSFNADCVADANPSSAYTAGNGTVLATVGSGGRSLNQEYPSLPQGPFFQTSMGSSSNGTYGFLKVGVSSTQLSASFVRGSGGSYTDSFTLTKSSSPPPPPTTTPPPTTPPPTTPPPTTPPPTTEPPTTAPPTTTPPPTGGPVTLTATDDSFVQSDLPTATHGSDLALYVDSSPIKITYLKFDTSAVAGATLSAATLKVTTTSGSSSGSPDTQVIHPVSDSSWTEAGLTYSSRPAVGTASLGSVSASASNTTYSIPLPVDQLQPLIGGPLTLAVDSTGGAGDAWYVNSREATTNPPQLVLTAG